MICPIFETFSKEFAQISKIVFSYPDLVISFAASVSHATGLGHPNYQIIHMINNLKPETTQIKAAQAIGENAFREKGLTREFDNAVRLLTIVGKRRNAYAHGIFGEWGGKLCILMNASKAFSTLDAKSKWDVITDSLLAEDVETVACCREYLRFLESKVDCRKGAERVYHEEPLIPKRLSEGHR